MNSRKNRLPEIIDILANQTIASQEELAKELAIRGYTTTQATLSRDLKLLKASKVADDRGGYRYVADTSANSIQLHTHGHMPSATTHHSVISLAVTGNLIVIKTRNGYASGLAYDIDSMNSDMILGTIPGADTVFVAVREGISRADLFDLFSSFIPTSVMSAAAGSFGIEAE